MKIPRVIALYLPQFHPTPDNDEWWGKGFTEWTNVGKATPLFPGHYQPKVPADLGYYDLRVAEVREQQAQMAKDAGIYGFCYYHYWFRRGKQELELPFNEVLASGKPDFPFMLCWANESWHAKFWDKDGKASSKKMLIEQRYDEDDIDPHFYHLLPAFKDPRYIKIEGCPVFMIYKLDDIPNAAKTISRWNELAKSNGFEGVCFISYLDGGISTESIKRHKSLGVQYVSVLRMLTAWFSFRDFKTRLFDKIQRTMHWPMMREYKKIYPRLIGDESKREDTIPVVLPNWDHTPRSGKNGRVMLNCTPELFKEHFKDAVRNVDGKKNPIIILKSWNEWGEGNYVEPDLKYGHGYLDVIKEVLK